MNHCAQCDAYPISVVPGLCASRPGIQIGTHLAPDASDEDIQFVQQLGVEWVMTEFRQPEDHTLENYRALVRRFDEHGLKIYRLAHHGCHNMPEVTLNLPDRDEKVAEYLAYIRMLGQTGIRYATYAHMGNGIWSSAPEAIRGGAVARALRLDQPKAGHWIGAEWHEPLSHGRAYSEDELWENYVYFIRQVVPVAEAAGVYIGIHPDDPPVYPLGGIPRCIFGTFEGYRRALEIANSPNIGVCLCVGCWLEGGAGMGADVVEAIRFFGGQRKLFKVHLRNVTAPMPEGFAETFLDDGAMDMLKVVEALHEVGFDGAIMSDHRPRMVGGDRAAEAYAVGYMRALIHTTSSR